MHNRNPEDQGKAVSAYDAVQWDQLSPHAKREIDRIASESGVVLHQATDEATLRRFIGIYRALNR